MNTDRFEGPNFLHKRILNKNTCVSNEFFDNTKLSFASIGLFVYLLSCEKTSVEEIIMYTSDDRATVNLLLEELKDSGYLKIQHNDWGLYEDAWMDNNKDKK